MTDMTGVQITLTRARTCASKYVLGVISVIVATRAPTLCNEVSADEVLLVRTLPEFFSGEATMAAVPAAKPVCAALASHGKHDDSPNRPCLGQMSGPTRWSTANLLLWQRLFLPLSHRFSYSVQTRPRISRPRQALRWRAVARAAGG
jgi:hypothetical protein